MENKETAGRELCKKIGLWRVPVGFGFVFDVDDFAKQGMEEENKNAFDAIYDACRIRFRPILMTGASTIMGAMPIAMGIGADGASRRPLGLIIVGGLLFAQVITLLVTPGIFLYMQTIQEKYLDRFEMSRSDAARKAADAA